MKFRQAFFKAHSYLGIAIGGILIVVSASGCFFMFHKELSNLLYADLYNVKPVPGARTLAADKIRRIAEEAYPVSPLREIVFKNNPASSVKIYAWDLHVIHINPYTGALLGIQDKFDDPFLLAWELHTTLCLGKFGGYVVNLCTLLVVPMVISGIILWWPRKKEKWKRVFILPIQGAWKSINYRWHAVGGFYISVFLFLIAVSGMMIGYKWFQDVVYYVSSSPPKYRETPFSIPSRFEREPLQKALDQVTGLFPDRYEAVIGIPSKEHGSYIFRITFNDALSKWHYLYFDQYSGKLLMAKYYENYSLGDKINTAKYQMHSGQILGVPGMIFVFFVTSFTIVLVVSGIIMWWQRYRITARN